MSAERGYLRETGNLIFHVALVGVLVTEPAILVFDEPTAVLTPQESEALFEVLHRMTAEGRSVIFISHKLDEVRQVADTITVIRRGTTVATVDPKSVTSRELAELMVGSALPTPQTEASTVTDKVVLQIDGLCLAEVGVAPVLSDIDLTIHAGEVLGIAGVEGNGQAELVEVIMGMIEPVSGTVHLEGEDISDWDVRRILKAYIDAETLSDFAGKLREYAGKLDDDE